MPERLMGTDYKFVGNMSTLVQIQLGPIIRPSTTRWYNPPCPLEIPHTKIEDKKESNFLLDPLFPWVCSSIGQSTAMSRRKLRARAPPVPTDPINPSIHFSLSMN
ncbi:uncharacterized mitochondrial protein atmg01060 [Phtheirospermum japonicum]|uniref:Uncharacterized mitochondrial protein atmg01060 n=1 Tax=Phtheirospermum japonicum TaxID=374723 RepID=A0A830D1H0_9LAMI|nr:uncharacterized mitochondrial protein atmg01060 [Phtheirospermum japonicum]